jgi:hypothetical protein
MKVPIPGTAVIALDTSVLPAFKARIKGTVRWVIWCKHCRVWHKHGPGCTKGIWWRLQMAEEDNTEDAPTSESDDGTFQDQVIALRFYLNQIVECCQGLILQAFGKEVTLEEARMLQEVYSPFDSESPDEIAEGMTQQEYDEERAAYFTTIEKLRPTFLRLFDMEEETAEYQVCDLGDPSTDEITPLDAFLVSAFRYRLRM